MLGNVSDRWYDGAGLQTGLDRALSLRIRDFIRIPQRLTSKRTIDRRIPAIECFINLYKPI